MMLTFQKEVAEVSFNFFWLFYHTIKLQEQNEYYQFGVEKGEGVGWVSHYSVYRLRFT